MLKATPLGSRDFVLVDLRRNDFEVGRVVLSEGEKGDQPLTDPSIGIPGRHDQRIHQSPGPESVSHAAYALRHVQGGRSAQGHLLLRFVPSSPGAMSKQGGHRNAIGQSLG